MGIALVLSACSGTAEASACEQASEAAATALADAHDAASQPIDIVTVDPGNVPPAPSVTPTDAFYISPESQARIDASLRNEGQRRAQAAEVRALTERWTILIEQHPDCFDVETRVRAEQVARQLER